MIDIWYPLIILWTLAYLVAFSLGIYACVLVMIELLQKLFKKGRDRHENKLENNKG